MYTNHLSAPSDHTRKYYKLLVQTLLYGLQAKYKGGTTGGATWHHHPYLVVPPIHRWCHVAPPPLLGGATTVLSTNYTFSFRYIGNLSQNVQFLSKTVVAPPSKGGGATWHHQ